MTIERESRRADRVQVVMEMTNPTVQNVLDFAAELAEAVGLGLSPDERVYINGHNPSRWSAFTETMTQLDPEWRQDRVTNEMVAAARMSGALSSVTAGQAIRAALTVAPKPEVYDIEEESK